MAMQPDDWHLRAIAALDLVNHGLVDEAEALSAGCPANEPVTMMLMGFVALERGEPTTAANLFQLACRLKPGINDWNVACAQAVLATGDWRTGFRLHEARPKRHALKGLLPTWDGKHVERLFVWSDEGVGDAVMFSRYIPLLKQRCDKLILGLPPNIQALMAGCAEHAEIVNTADGVIADAEVAMMSAPMYFETTPDTVPPDAGLLRAGAVNGSLTDPTKRNIGIAWTGNQEFKRKHLRDMPLETMLGLAEDPDNRLWGLVVGKRAGDIAAAGAQAIVTDMSGHILSDFSATAAVINAMDVIVTTCNGVAHIAGALGKPTFLCLATLPDWRWLYNRADTPWYPSVTLVRQTKPNEWGPVIAEVREKLAEVPVGQARVWGERSKRSW